MKPILAAALLGAALLAAPAAFADGARDDLIRTEAEVKALNTADASAAAATNYAEAQLRLSEARVAEEKNREEESMWRSAEASLQAEIVQEKIKLRGLERTVSEIETGIATLRREIIS
jgi:septal ring factor EnvC (AmiA/AmiB activator)